MKKHVPEMNLWNIPLYAVPAIIKTLENETSKKVLNTQYEEAKSGLYALNSIKEEYAKALEEHLRVYEEEEDGDQDE